MADVARGGGAPRLRRDGACAPAALLELQRRPSNGHTEHVSEGGPQRQLGLEHAVDGVAKGALSKS